jgi:mono/diheme cytochrome c family protein
MRKKAAAISALGLLAFACLFAPDQEKKPPATEEFKIPPEAAKRENPVKPTAASLADGKHVFASQCAMCHGKDGDGKGDLAADMKLKLRDYRDPAGLKDVTDGEMFYILTKGKGDMPGEEDRMKPDQRWNLINYIRSLSKGKAATKTEESKPPSL